MKKDIKKKLSKFRKTWWSVILAACLLAGALPAIPAKAGDTDYIVWNNSAAYYDPYLPTCRYKLSTQTIYITGSGTINYGITNVFENYSDFAFIRSDIKKIVFSNCELNTDYKENNFANLFANFISLEEVDFSGLSFSAESDSYICNAAKMFYNCPKLKFVDISKFKFDIDYKNKLSDMFGGCTSLQYAKMNTYNNSRISGLKITLPGDDFWVGCAGYYQKNTVELSMRDEITTCTKIYNITYNLNGGTNNENNRQRYMSSDGATLHDPTKTGCEFRGWYSDLEFKNRVSSIEAGSSGDITLYACFIPKYTIILEPNGASESRKEFTFYISDMENFPNDMPYIFAKKYYSSSGWNTMANGKGTGYPLNAKIKDLNFLDDNSITLYAQWTPLPYGINYVLNGSNAVNPGINPSTYTIETDTITLRDAFRPGYTFAGWYDNANFTGSPVNQIPKGSTGEKRFYAKWTPNTYNITYGNMTGATNHSDNPATFTSGSTIYFQAPTKTGYQFKGWSIPAIYPDCYQNIITNANWTPIQYAITYNNMGDAVNNPANPKTYTINDAVTFAEPTRTGYRFTGWTPASIAGGSMGDKTVTASWTPIIYHIEYKNLNGAVNPQKSTVQYTIETDTITLQDAVRRGYTFHGWYSDPDYKTKVTSIPKGSYGDLDLYANITKDTYTITYGNMEGAENNASNPSDYQVDTPDIDFEKPSKVGYTFGGWYSDAECSIGHRVPGIPTDSVGDVTVYAKWTVNVYNIAYENIAGLRAVNHEDNPLTYTVEDEITFKDPTRTAYDFAGWFREFDLTDRTTGIGKGTIEDQTVYAGWTPTVYNICYHNLENIFLNPDNPSTYTVEDKNIVLEAPAKLGYDFGGWYEDEKLTVFSWDAGVPSGSYGDKDFYAKWDLVNYGITYQNTMGAENNSPATYTIEDDDILLDDLEKTGYVFNGWVTSGDAVTGAVLPHGSCGDKIYTADWTIIDYPVTYYGIEEITGENPNPPTYTIESDAIFFKDPEKTGFTFKGWFSDQEHTQPVSSIPKGSCGDAAVYADWEINTYTVTYANTDDVLYNGNPLHYNILSGDIELTDPVRDGYTFLGWIEDGSAPEKKVVIKSGSVGNRTFKAVWEANPCIAVFNANGGVGSMENQEFYADDYLGIAENRFTREGYTFAGWDLDKDANPMELRIFDRSRARNISSRHGQTITLYAIWVENSSFDASGDEDASKSKPIAAISYDLGGGVIPVEGNPAFYKNDQTGEIVLINPVKEGYEFVGWTGTGLRGLTMEVIIPAGATGSRRYKAHYEGETHNVTFYTENPDGKDDVSSIIFYTEDLDCGTIVCLPSPAPQKEGCDFTGWSRGEVGFVRGHCIYDDEYWVAGFTKKFDDSIPDAVLPGEEKPEISVPGAILPGEEKPGVLYRSITLNYMSSAGLPLTSTMKVENGTTIAAPTPETPEGQTFKEWDDADGCAHNFARPVIEDVTINAVYLKVHKLSAPAALIRNGVEYNSVYMVKGQTLTLTGKGYKSNDKATVSVAKKAGNKSVLTAKKAGMAIIKNGADQYLVYVSAPKMAKSKIKLSVGDGCQVRLNDLDENLEVSWMSSKPTVAQVINGYVYAAGKGSATITATINGIAKKCTVTVTEKPVNPSKIEEGAELSMYPGQKLAPAFADGFKAKGAKIMNIEGEYVRFYPKTGTLMALKQGRTKVSLEQNGIQKSFIVNIQPRLGKKEIYVEQGSVAKIVVPGVPASKIDWKIAETPVIATVKKNKITGVAAGDGVLRGEYKGILYEMNVHVYSTALRVDDNLTHALNKKGDPIANKYTLSIKPGESYVIDHDSLKEELLNWKSGRKSVAIVNELGIVTAVKKGTATITAKVGGRTISIKVIVSDDAPNVSAAGGFSYKRVNLSGGWSAFIGRDGKYVYDRDK